MEEGVKPLNGRARWAIVALAAVIASDILTFVFDVLEIRLMNDLGRGELELRLTDDLDQVEVVGLSRLQADDLRQGIAAGLYFLAFVLAAVFFILWFHRAYSNLAALGVTKRRFDSNAAIWPWFVPILNLWRPKQVANDIWRGSDPVVASRRLNLAPGPVPALLGFWWAGYIVTNALAGRAARLWWDTPSAEDAGLSALQGDTSGADSIRAAASLELAAVSVDIVAAILAIVVVRRLTARQLERERVVEQLPSPVA